MRLLVPELAQAGEVAPEGVDGRSGVWLVVCWALAALPLLALRGLSVHHAWPAASYVPLHIIAEIAIVLVGFSTAAVQWYAAGARGLREARARFIGAAFLGASLLEAVHLLVFPGMPGLLGPSSVERGIYYWLLARGWMVGTLLASALIAPESEHPLLRRGPLLALNLAVAAAGIAVELNLPASPGLFFHPGSGLTRLKIGLEMCIGGAAGVGAAMHFARWRAGGDRAPLRIAAALGIVALSETCFALYASAHDVYNLLGHVYALAAAALIFDGLFVAALIRPYERLDETTRDLAASNARLDALHAHVEGELAATISRLEEASAREAHARAELEAAFAAVPDGVAVYAPDGRIVRMNAAARELLQYAAECEAPPAECWARLAPQTTDGKAVAAADNPIVRALRGDVVSAMPFSIESPGRGRAWITVSAAATRAPDGRISGAVAAITDVSALQQLQSQREDLLRAVSHDLRNPLQIVLLQAERLQRLLPPALEKERSAADRITAAARGMGVMIRDLVEVARMEDGRLVLALQPIELAPFLARLLQLQAGALEIARVRLDLPPGLPPASADPARLERIVTNLVANALKYGSPGTEVTLSAELRGDQIAVSVRDRGPGIPAKDLPRVFERFFRGSATQKQDGLGLGLYIVQLLVEAHGGRVWANSAPGDGATFTFTVPAA
jgi:signal transduction histidine kinase